MFLDDYHAFLIQHSGMTGKIVNILLSENAKEPDFFEPWQSETEPLLKTLSIITAPVCLTILTAEFTLAAVVIAFKSLFELFIDPDKAKSSAGMACSCLLLVTISLLAVFVSPVVNAFDLMGGAVNTVLDQCSEEDNSYSCF